MFFINYNGFNYKKMKDISIFLYIYFSVVKSKKKILSVYTMLYNKQMFHFIFYKN